VFTLNPTRPMSKTLRVLSALLGYPDAQLRGYLPEMHDLLHAEGALAQARLAEIDALIDALERAEPMEAEADYVELFDRGRGTSLHLFEHVHGDSRERGPAMIDLGQTYAQAGLNLAEGELPDYLPAVLEFASTQPPREARAFLGETAHILNAIFSALQQRRSAYAGVLGALLELAGETAQPVKLAAEEPLDESWAEPPVFDGCSSKGQARPGQPQPVRLVRAGAKPGAVA
jgi:nitrate reductase delta subunit